MFEPYRQKNKIKKATDIFLSGVPASTRIGMTNKMVELY